MRFAMTGNNEGIKAMLGKREAFPNDTDVFGTTALHVGDYNTTSTALSSKNTE
jgi:hypothetical protein